MSAKAVLEDQTAGPLRMASGQFLRHPILFVPIHAGTAAVFGFEGSVKGTDGGKSGLHGNLCHTPGRAG